MLFQFSIYVLIRTRIQFRRIQVAPSSYQSYVCDSAYSTTILHSIVMDIFGRKI